MKPFTLSYAQPSEYRFSLDSIETPFEISKSLKEQSLQPKKILDLCAGCGVMGLELAFHLEHSLELDFVEVQSIYQDYLLQNIQSLKATDLEKKWTRHLEIKSFYKNYTELLGAEWQNQYDLIVCNPPYFFPEQGLLSPNLFKNRCRFFLDATQEELWESILHCLKPGAQAFVLARVDSLQEIRRRLRYQANVEAWMEIRGTTLLRITKSC